MFIEVATSDSIHAESYATLLEPYNIETLDAALSLLSGDDADSQNFQRDLDREAKSFMNEVR